MVGCGDRLIRVHIRDGDVPMTSNGKGCYIPQNNRAKEEIVSSELL